MKLFYCAGKVHTLKSEDSVRQVIRHGREVLVERGAVTQLAWGDKQASVLGVKGPAGAHGKSYSAYGVHEFSAELAGVIGFSGYYFDAMSTYCLLGNGYRSYGPRMMRFLSPDSLSPFERGGLNAYGYCAGDPINRVDENGRFWDSALIVKSVKFKVRKIDKSEVKRIITFAEGKRESTVKVAKFSKDFKEAFDMTPKDQLRIEDMVHIKALVMYRSMQNAKRAYVAAAVYGLDVPTLGMFRQQYSQVTRMVGKLQRIGSLTGKQQAHTANMVKIDDWLQLMKKNRDVEAIRLAGLLEGE